MKLALRMDDVGASSKHLCQYGVWDINLFGKKAKINNYFTNFLFLKKFSKFRKWGPYDELSVANYEELFNFLSKKNLRITLGITACWVDHKNVLTPYYEKFPKSAEFLKQASKDNIVEIANHGLTHCVVGKQSPRLFSGNKKYHREFWDWVPPSVHYEHIQKSQNLLQEYFDCSITTLIPPGNVFTLDTVNAASKTGIKLINCNAKTENIEGVQIIGNKNIFDFHDREIKLFGVKWLEDQISNFQDVEFCFVKDLI